MKKYLYTGEMPCHIDLKEKDEVKPYSLFAGEVYELPEKDPLIIVLEAQGLLIVQKPLKK